MKLKKVRLKKFSMLFRCNFSYKQFNSKNVIKQILQGQDIWKQIIFPPESRSEI